MSSGYIYLNRIIHFEVFMGFWEFTKLARKNPSHTKTFLNSFNQRGFTQAQVLAREIIQNSTDAGKGFSGTTRLEFQTLTFVGENKERLIELLGMRDALLPRVADMSKRAADLGVARAIEKFFRDEQVTTLLIRDFNTCGLGGRLFSYEDKDHFHKLVCATHLDNKSDKQVMGGSFGLGKTAYAKASDIYTVMYHSTFKETAETDGHTRRLMVSGVYPMHQYAGQGYEGFGYFGERGYQDNGEEEAIPFSNDKAENLWNQIGALSLESSDLSRRNDQHGTDILIFSTDIDLAELQRATEDFWFPSLLRDELSVKFIHSSGLVTTPDPETREDLDQFIRLWRCAHEGKEIKNERELRVESFQRMGGKLLGTIAMERAEEDEAASEKANTVAIMRGGTNLVLSYQKTGSDRFEKAVGVFIGADEVSELLQASEDEAHSEWNFQSDRLRRNHGDEGKKIVQSVCKRIGDHFSRFQKALQPEVPKNLSKGGLLSRLLTQVLIGDGKTNDDVDPGEDAPFARSFRLISRTAEISRWNLRIFENELSPSEPVEVRLKLGVHVAGEKMVAVKRKNFSVKNRDGDLFDQDNLVFEFSRTAPIDLIIEFDSPGNFNYKLGATVTVKNSGRNVTNEVSYA
jgi:hypothetical protein